MREDARGKGRGRISVRCYRHPAGQPLRQIKRHGLFVRTGAQHGIYGTGHAADRCQSASSDALALIFGDAEKKIRITDSINGTIIDRLAYGVMHRMMSIKIVCAMPCRMHGLPGLLGTVKWGGSKQ